MNPAVVIEVKEANAPIRMQIRVEESWINRYLDTEKVVIPLNDPYQLGHLSFGISPGKLTLHGEIVEKPGSFIGLTCIPRWNVIQQRIYLDDLQLQTRSKNLLVKSAGWFAQAFLQQKLDARVEQATNQMYAHYMDLIQTQPLEIPFPKGGTVRIEVAHVEIEEMHFREKALDVRATVEGQWNLHLSDPDRP